ncbi:MAG: DUF86 domain-containing protein [Bryobacterales bacterium]|nr:DUF86 domain-containing protein [Bryobacterales bacterium]
MSESDRIRLQHISEAAQKALRFIDGRRREDLDTDEQLLFAVIRALEVLGEAAVKLSPEARSRFPEVPWSQVIGMRNRLIHAYDDVNRDIVWATVTRFLPPLVATLEKGLAP